MYVRVDGYESVPAGGALPEQPPHFYWRSAVYPLYNGRGWYAPPGPDSALVAGQPLATPVVDSPPGPFLAINQHVERQGFHEGALFFTGELLSANPAYRAVWLPSGELFGAQVTSSFYSARSRLPDASADELRAAGTGYPEAIRRTYLQLPDSVPRRVRALALEITAAWPTPYDQATAIETYLRENYPYTLDVPAPPPGEDVADVFLFEWKKGFCDHYATAMAILARSAGIPARLVTGFSSGEYNPVEGRFVVRMVNAHAWVEIYFPGYGWVEFEPTGNMPPMERRGEDAGPAGEAAALAPGGQFAGQSGPALDFQVLAALLGTLALVPLGALAAWFLRLEQWRLLRLPAGQSVSLVYRRLYRAGRRWNLGTDPARTPGEFAEALCARLRPLADKQGMAAPLQVMVDRIRLLAGLYQRNLYAAQPVGETDRRRAVEMWVEVRRLLRWAYLRHRLGK
jgi:transglutaminase-like putative cysteine protease